MSEVAGLLTGVSVLLVFGAIAYFIFWVGSMYKSLYDTETVYSIYERVLVKDNALCHGFDLDREMAIEREKNDLFKDKSFKALIREQIVSEHFTKDDEEEEQEE